MFSVEAPAYHLHLLRCRFGNQLLCMLPLMFCVLRVDVALLCYYVLGCHFDDDVCVVHLRRLCFERSASYFQICVVRICGCYSIVNV